LSNDSTNSLMPSVVSKIKIPRPQGSKPTQYQRPLAIP